MKVKIKFRFYQPLLALAAIMTMILYHLYLLLLWPFIFVYSLFCKSEVLFDANETFTRYIPDIPADLFNNKGGE